MIKTTLSFFFIFTLFINVFSQEVIDVDFETNLNLIYENNENVAEFSNKTKESAEGKDIFKWSVSGGEEGKNWKFSNGSAAADKDVSIQFISVGNYSISLSCKNKTTKGKGKMKKKNFISVVGKYPKLAQLYVEDNHKKLVKSAEKYTLNEKLKSDPIPYVWFSRGLYKIYTSGDNDAAFQNAFNDSYGALSKAIKADVNGAIQNDTELDNYVNTFKLEYIQSNIDAHIEIINAELQNDKKSQNKTKMDKSLSKLNGFAKKYLKISNNKIGGQLLQMATFYQLKNSQSAKEIWKTLEGDLKSLEYNEDYSEADLLMMKYGSMFLCRYWKSVNNVENSCFVLKKTNEFLSDEEDFFDFYVEEFDACE